MAGRVAAQHMPVRAVNCTAPNRAPESLCLKWKARSCDGSWSIDKRTLCQIGNFVQGCGCGLRAEPVLRRSGQNLFQDQAGVAGYCELCAVHGGAANVCNGQAHLAERSGAQNRGCGGPDRDEASLD